MKKLAPQLVAVAFLTSLVSGTSALATLESAPETGPTITLDYGRDKYKPIPANDFMYFVPIVSTTPIDSKTSKSNTQTARITSFSKSIQGRKFTVLCDFEMKGKGAHRNTYEPVAMIDTYAKIRKTKTLTSMLDYIVLEGQGKGTVQIDGQIIDGREQVTDVKVHFNRSGAKSPVSIGIYNVKSKKGEFNYAHRYKQMVVRVNALAFKKTDKDPKMYVTVASIVKAKKKEGVWGNLMGAIANLFIPPVEIDTTGNNAMIDFGRALAQKSNSFTFPKAKNLIETIPPEIVASADGTNK